MYSEEAYDVYLDEAMQLQKKKCNMCNDHVLQNSWAVAEGGPVHDLIEVNAHVLFCSLDRNAATYLA